MRYETELMRAILKNEMAQRLVDYVSPVYGNSYVALWIFQAIGTVLGESYNLGDQIKYETNPLTSTIMQDYWEEHYGIARDTSLTVAQRQNRIVSKIRTRGACNPAKLAAAVSTALGGVKVDIHENTARNTFRVNIREYVPDITTAVAVLERMKPAHLIYQMQVALQTVSPAELRVAIATTRAESYKLEVHA